MMLGECPWRAPNSHVRLFSAPKVLGFHETIFKDDTLEATAQVLVVVGSNNDVILVWGRLTFGRLVCLEEGTDSGIGLLCEMN